MMEIPIIMMDVQMHVHFPSQTVVVISVVMVLQETVKSVMMEIPSMAMVVM